jgi:MFS family permease
MVLSLLLGGFGLYGGVIGAEGVLWPAMMTKLKLGEGTFGTAQLTTPLVAILLMFRAGPLTARFGKKQLMLAGLGALLASLLALSRADGLGGFVMALALSGLSFGLIDISVNSTMLDWDPSTGRPAMNILHASFSTGAVLGALGAGALLNAGRSHGEVLVWLSVMSGVSVLLALYVRFPPAEAASEETKGEATPVKLLWGRRALLTMAALAFLGALVESIANTWSVIYLSSLGARSLLGGVAFALFNGTMVIGRLVNTPLLARRGARVSLLASGALLVLGAASLLLVPGSLPLAIAALGLIGLGVAGVVPTALGEASRLAPGNSGVITGSLMGVVNLGFIFCPPAVGWIAELVSLHAALLGVGVCGALVLWLAMQHRASTL